MVMGQKVKFLVIDTAAFVKQVPLWEYGEELYCISEVLNEIRDKQTRHFIDALPIQLQFRQPSPTSVKFINDFTKKTGDFASLSLVDVKILALTYELETQAKNGSSHLRSEPVPQRTQQLASNAKSTGSAGVCHIPGFYMEKDKFRNTSTDITEDSSPVSEVSSPVSDSLIEETAEEFSLCEKHFRQLDDHLSLYTYTRGYAITGDDVFLTGQLQNHFPLLKELSDLHSRHRVGGQLHLMQNVCRQNYLTELVSDESKGTSTACLNSTDECSSMRVARQFSLAFSHWMHFVRWYLHMLTYDEVELKNIQNVSESSMSLPELFNWLSSHDTETTKKEDEEACPNSTADLGLGESETEKDIHSAIPTHDHNPVDSSRDCLAERSEVQAGREKEQIQSHNKPETGLEGEEEEEKEEDDDEEESSSCGSETESEVELESSTKGEEEEYDSDDGWITPSNFRSAMRRMGGLDEASADDDVQVACITADYSMQNTLKHIGLSVMGVNGKLINSLRTFILRCHACFKTTDKMEKIFCSHCGHKTLKKVSVTLNPDGTQKIWINTRRPISTRGTKFSLPRPQGGKHAVNPILVADQREAQQMTTKLGRLKNDPLHQDYIAGASPFMTRDVYSRSAQLGITTGKKQHRGMFYWEQKNPNVPMKKGGSKRKKR